MDWNGDDDLVSKDISSLRNYTGFSVRFNSSEQDVSGAENSLLMIRRKRTKIIISYISFLGPRGPIVLPLVECPSTRAKNLDHLYTGIHAS